MSQRERDRLKVLHEVQKGQLSQKQGAAQLGLTDRWARKLLKRLCGEGDRGIVHRLRGRPSNRQLPVALRERAVPPVKEYHEGLWTDAGHGVLGEARPDSGEQGDAAEVVDRSRNMEGPAAARLAKRVPT